MDTDYWKSSPFEEESIFHPSFDNKDLKIRYVFCQKDDKYTYLYFDITARNLSSEKAALVVVESEVFKDDAIVSQTININKNGTKRFRVRVNEMNLSKSIFEGEFEFKATVSCDGLSATTGEFRIKCGSRSNVSTSNKLEQKKSDQEESLQNYNCGAQYAGLVRCLSRNEKYGPVFYGNLPMNSYQNYNTLISNKVLTEDEKLIILAMSDNEGNFDSVQSYDSEVLSAGVMQKTIKSDGMGEFPLQVWEFKQNHSEKYEALLNNCNWTVCEDDDNNIQMFYNGVTGEDLKSVIRNGFNKDNVGKSVDCPPLYPIISLLKDPDFIEKQIIDFIGRLHSCLAKIPLDYNHPISDYVCSLLGKAVVLDHDVNRPGHVKLYFSEALNRLFTSDPAIPKNPAEWGDKHSDYESALVTIYGPLRGEKLRNVKHPMTDAIKRYNHLKAKL